jgi:hypothetical protein
MVDRLKVTELDFDTIKSNLKNFLRQQSEFSDYDFDGAGLSVLIDLLAYNTHYNAYYLNMVANEAFLDTALLRDSVVSHAKTFGYTPYSKTAPTATITLTSNSSSSAVSTLTIPEGFSFLSNQIDGKAYNFVVLDDVTVTKANSQYVFENLDIREGQLVTYQFVHSDLNNPKQIFILPDSNIDTETIKVFTTPTTSNTSITTYNRATEILDVTSNSNVFFLQENRNGNYEIYFGNNIVGKKIPDGSVLSVTYLVTNGDAANKANNFIATDVLIDNLGEAISNFTINPISAAAGGAERETVDEIKFSSPLQYTTQNRLVTKNDYQSYIKRNYPSIDSLSVWGGEDEDPPIYGKVLISLKPKQNYFLTETEKQRILDEIISPKAIITVDAEIRDPEYLYILLNNFVKYDPKKTTLSASVLSSQIRNAILSYRNINLNKFGSIFALSKVQDSIDSVDTVAIVGSETNVKLQRRVQPSLGITTNYEINFNVPLIRGTLTNRLTSTEFRVLDSLGITRTAIIEETPQSFSGISSIEITNAGYGFTSAPTITINGDGTGATAVAVVQNGRITQIKITNRGVDYTRATVSITGGGGFSAAATPIIDAKIGTLRTIYFDENANRQIINSSVGTIDYETGVVLLNDLQILSVIPSDGLLRLTVGSEEGVIESIKNTIITIDEEDTSSIINTVEEIQS